MTPETLALVLIAAVAHATWNLASAFKRGDTVSFVTAYTAVSAVLCLPFGIGLAVAGVQPVTWQLAGAALVSAALHAAYSLTLQAGYDRAPLGVVYPVARGVGPLLSMSAAVLVLGERITWLGALGGLAIVTGVLIVAGGSARQHGERRTKGVLWGSATGALIAAYTLWDAYAIGELGLVPLSYFAATLLAETLLLLPALARRDQGLKESIRLDVRPILFVAMLSPLAYVLVLTAMQSAPVALIAPLRETSIVIGSLAAWLLFHERRPARRLIGALVVLAGITAIGM